MAGQTIHDRIKLICFFSIYRPFCIKSLIAITVCRYFGHFASGKFRIGVPSVKFTSCFCDLICGRQCDLVFRSVGVRKNDVIGKSTTI